MAFRFHDPLHRAMDAQATNLGRLGSGETLDGTDNEGQPKVLTCPAPNIIRLWDTPLRMLASAVHAGLERALTIHPAMDDELGRIVQRKDREYEYWIHGVVRLTRDEEQADAAAGGTDNPLALKVDHLLHDVKLLVDDNNLLITDDCPSGLVSSAFYGVRYNPKDVQYPTAMFILVVRGELAQF